MEFRFVLIVLSMIGLYISIYFSLVFYQVISPENKLVPEWCRMENKTCELVVHTNQGRILWLPNSVFGILYYSTQVVFVMVLSLYRSSAIQSAMTVISAIPFLMSLCLLYALRVQLKTHCVLCYICNGINILLFLIYIIFGSRL
jgi:uncharacterized membrane protein